MKYRCYGPKLDERTAKAYRDKGIRVCEEWLGYYGNFEAWALSHGYEPDLTIDRIDPDGNYCPENCRWIPKSENCGRSRRFELIEEVQPMVPQEQELPQIKGTPQMTAANEHSDAEAGRILQLFRMLGTEDQRIAYAVLEGMHLQRRLDAQKHTQTIQHPQAVRPGA